MEINEFVDLNTARCYSDEAKKVWGDTSKRDLTDWALCIAGEAGELCNAVKKYQMYENDPEQSLSRRNAVIDEASDTIIYCILLMSYLGVNVENRLIYKFNIVSERIGWKPEANPYA